MPRPENGNEEDACRNRRYLESRIQPTRGSPHPEVGHSEESSTVKTIRLRNIKQDLKLGRIISRMGVEWIHLAQDTNNLQPLVIIVMNSRVRQSAGNFVNSCGLIGLSRTLPQGVRYCSGYDADSSSKHAV